MGLFKGSVLLLGFTVLFLVSAAEVLVQLNVNRPFNDVNEKFVSFSIKPEDLYNGLDGSNRDMVTRMATLLGSSYIKLLGGYNLDKQNEVSKRNPTRVIWKGFNRWSRTVNWTMIMPIDYTPEEWEPMETLKALNNSYISGIHDCIYQFGADSSVLRANSYLEDFRTFDLMLEAFRPNVHKWQAVGADVSPGITADEINRFVETSRHYSAAFGWKQSSDEKLVAATQMDTSLRTMMAKKVPVWLNLPQQKRTKRIKAAAVRNTDDELSEGMKYAQVLGDAASSGFDAVFKYISAADLEKPTFSTFVSALFKKVMGSRVFPSKLLHLFKQDQKLYTHCANGISGGMAFMAINKEERPLHININSLTKLKPTEVLQYSISMKKAQVFLNGAKIYVNSTLKPYVRTKPTNTAIKLLAPPFSVNYWVLPSVDLEHCQFLEMEEDQLENSAEEQKIVKKRHSAAEKLISQLIRETKIPKESFSKKLERSRRAINGKNRVSRSFEEDNIMNNLFGNNWLNQEAFGVFRQELKRRGRNALDWIQTILDIVRTYDVDERNVRRRTRALHEISNARKPTHDIMKRRYKNKKVSKSDEIDGEDLLRELEELLKKEYYNHSEENLSSSEEHHEESAESLRKHELRRWLDETPKDSTTQKYRQKNEAQEFSKALNELFKFNKKVNSKPRTPKKIKNSDVELPNENFKKMQNELYKAIWNYRSEEESEETNKPYMKDSENSYEEMPVNKISWWDEEDEEHKLRSRRSAKLSSPQEDSRENRVDSHEIYFPKQAIENRKQIIVQKTENIDKKSTEKMTPYNFLDTVTNRVVKFIDVMTRQVNNFPVKIQPNAENSKNSL